MAVQDGWVERFHGDELIVAIPQLGVVLEALRECGVEIGDRGIEENAVLGLARLSHLRGVEPAAQQLVERSRLPVRDEVRAYRDVRRKAHPEAPDVSALALLIKSVKVLLA